MAGSGGARPGAGAKKGQHRVHVKELRDAIEAAMGEPFQVTQAKVYVKLFNHFQNDEFIKEFIVYNENIGKRILENPVQEVAVVQSPYEELSDSDLQGKIDNLLTRQALSQSSETDAQDGNEENTTA